MSDQREVWYVFPAYGSSGPRGTIVVDAPQDDMRRRDRFTWDCVRRYSKYAELRDTQSDFVAQVDTDDVDRDAVLSTLIDVVAVLNRHADEVRR